MDGPIFRYEKAQINLINYMVRNKGVYLSMGGQMNTPDPMVPSAQDHMSSFMLKITFSLAIRSNFSFFLSNFFCGFIGNEVFNVFNGFLFICV